MKKLLIILIFLLTAVGCSDTMPIVVENDTIYVDGVPKVKYVKDTIRRG